MKVIVFSAMLCCTISLPALAELSQDDLNKIRLIVKEEVEAEIAPIKEAVKAEIAPIKEAVKDLDTRLQKVEQAVARLDGRFDGVNHRFDGIEKRITQSNNILYALIALIIFAIGLPAWQNRRDRDEKKKIEALTERLEALEQQRSVNP